MITKEGFNDDNEHCWKLYVTCIPGLEVGIIATDSGLLIDGNLILWGELEIAKRAAKKLHSGIVRRNDANHRK